MNPGPVHEKKMKCLEEKPGLSMMAEMIQVNDVTNGWKETAQETAVRHLAIKGDVCGYSETAQVAGALEPLNKPKPTRKHSHFPDLTGWEDMTPVGTVASPLNPCQSRPAGAFSFFWTCFTCIKWRDMMSFFRRIMSHNARRVHLHVSAMFPILTSLHHHHVWGAICVRPLQIARKK